MDHPEHGAGRTSNLAVVREVYAAFARRDINGILALLSPDVLWSEPENPFNPAAGTRHGHAGFLEWARASGMMPRISKGSSLSHS
jgi:ketosteroid isomerase-like protein